MEMFGRCQDVPQSGVQSEVRGDFFSALPSGDRFVKFRGIRGGLAGHELT